jgi:hypothetical protein
MADPEKVPFVPKSSEPRQMTTFPIEIADSPAQRSPANAVIQGAGGYNPYEVGDNEVLLEVGDYERDDPACNNKLNLIFTLFFAVALILLLWCWSPFIVGGEGVGLSSEECYNSGFGPYLILGFVGVFYLSYMIETGCSPTCGYLGETSGALGIHEHIDRVRAERPSLWFSVECWHNETHTYTKTDSEGRSTTHTETRKVVTYREKSFFNFRQWDDISGDLRGLATIHNVTRLRFSKTYVFADDHTEHAYKHAAHEIQARNRHRDTYMDFSSGMDIRGYVDRMLCVRDRNRMHCCMNMGCFCLSSWFLCGYCYRSWFDSSTIKQRYKHIKRLQI